MKEQGLAVRVWATAAILTMLVASQSSFAANPRAREDEEELTIMLRVYDYAQVP